MIYWSARLRRNSVVLISIPTTPPPPVVAWRFKRRHVWGPGYGLLSSSAIRHCSFYRVGGHSRRLVWNWKGCRKSVPDMLKYRHMKERERAKKMVSIGRTTFLTFSSIVRIWPRRGYSIYPWVGRCGPAPQTLTLFKTKIVRFLIPCLSRHLAQNYTLFKKFAKERYPV